MTIRSSDLRKRLLRVVPTMLVGAVLKDIQARSTHDWLLLCAIDGGQAILSVEDLVRRVATLRDPLGQALGALDLRASPTVDMEAELATALALLSATGYVLVLRDEKPYGVLTAQSVQSQTLPARMPDPLESAPVAKDPAVLSSPAASLLEQAATWQPRRQGPAVLSMDDDVPTVPVTSAAIEPIAQRSDRYVNTDFAAENTPDQALDKQVALQPGQTYFFRLNVGDLELETTIEASRALLPDFITTQDVELVVVLFSESFTIAQATGVLAVPTAGLATVKQPASLPSGMSADAALAQERLLFRVQTPAMAGRADLRVNMYCKGMLIQSRLVTAVIGQGAVLNQAGATRISTLDFNLSPTLAPGYLAGIAQHKLSVMLNTTDDGNHSFRLMGEDGQTRFANSATLSPSEISDLIRLTRSRLQFVAWGTDGEWDGTANYKYARSVSADVRLNTCRSDLIALARRGALQYSGMIQNLAGSKDDAHALRELMREPGMVQMSSKISANDVVPVEIFYDSKIDIEADLTICDAFEASRASGRPLIDEPCFLGHCPNRDKFTVVCPSGFWGFRHDIGMPYPVAQRGREMAQEISYTDNALMNIAFFRDFPEVAGHLDRLSKLGYQSQSAFPRQQIISMFQGPSPQMVYFYCHGALRESLPFLRVGTQDGQYGSDYFNTSTFSNLDIEWPTTRPLVFINGCHTTALSPDKALSFVKTFVQDVEAAGVIGTEITIFEPLAQDFAETFLPLFLSGMPLGRAIRAARLKLLAQPNPLGLVYLPYAYAGLRLVKRP